MGPRPHACAADWRARMKTPVSTNAQTIGGDCRMLGWVGVADRLAAPGPDPVQAPTRVYHARRDSHVEGEIAMLYTIAVVLLVAWLLGIVGTYTIGAFVHLLLVVAIVLFLVGLVSGRRTLA